MQNLLVSLYVRSNLVFWMVAFDRGEPDRHATTTTGELTAAAISQASWRSAAQKCIASCLSNVLNFLAGLQLQRLGQDVWVRWAQGMRGRQLEF